MEPHFAAIRPSLPFPSCSPRGFAPSMRSNSRTLDNSVTMLQLLPHAYLDDKSRKPRDMQETMKIAPTASQKARFPPPSLLTQAPSSLAPLSELSAAAHDARKRKLDVDSYVSSPAQLPCTSDNLATNALARLTLSALSDYDPVNFDSMSFNSFPPSRNTESPPQSVPTSPSTSPTSSPITIQRSDVSCSSSEVPMSPPSSSSSSPPSSPPLKKRVVEIRHKGKQLKSRCTCCHVCRTSLKNYPRNHLDCTACNAVVCQPCIEFRLNGASWEEASKEPNWLCPACLGTCVCPRCSSRPLEIATKSQFSQKRKSENNKIKKRKEPRSNSDEEARQQRLEELMEYYKERERFIHEIQNVLCIVKRDQREIEYQIAALQTQGQGEAEDEDEQ